MSHAVKLENEHGISLPPSLISNTDVGRLIRELEAVDNEFEQQLVRSPGQPPVVPSLSRSLASLCQQNNLQLADAPTRAELRAKLVSIKDTAPVVHITFASEAEPEVLGQLVAWIRDRLHPLALITTGQQPTIVGGCIVRTPDHIYDFSLRERFNASRSSFVDALHGALAKTPYIQATTQPEATDGN